MFILLTISPSLFPSMSWPRGKTWQRLDVFLRTSLSNQKSILLLWKARSQLSLEIWPGRMHSWPRKSSTRFTQKVKWCDTFATCRRRTSVLIDRWFLWEVALWSLMLPARWLLWPGPASTCILLSPTIKPLATFRSSKSWGSISSQLLDLMKLASSQTVVRADSTLDCSPLPNTWRQMDRDIATFAWSLRLRTEPTQPALFWQDSRSSLWSARTEESIWMISEQRQKSTRMN